MARLGAFTNDGVRSGVCAWMDGAGQIRILYSLRHTSMLRWRCRMMGTDIHALSKQMDNSAAIIERHYSKLTATKAAERFV